MKTPLIAGLQVTLLLFVCVVDAAYMLSMYQAG